MDLEEIKKIYLDSIKNSTRLNFDKELLDKFNINILPEKLDCVEYEILGIILAYQTLNSSEDKILRKILKANPLNIYYEILSKELLKISIQRLPSGYVTINPDNPKRISKRDGISLMKKIPIRTALRSYGASELAIDSYMENRKRK